MQFLHIILRGLKTKPWTPGERLWLGSSVWWLFLASSASLHLSHTRKAQGSESGGFAQCKPVFISQWHALYPDCSKTLLGSRQSNSNYALFDFQLTAAAAATRLHKPRLHTPEAAYPPAAAASSRLGELLHCINCTCLRACHPRHPLEPECRILISLPFLFHPPPRR